MPPYWSKRVFFLRVLVFGLECVLNLWYNTFADHWCVRAFCLTGEAGDGEVIRHRRMNFVFLMGYRKMQKSFQTNKTRRKHEVNGFTLVELLVVIAVIALLMAILLPALTKAKEQGKRAVCLTHIKQLQLAWGNYCDTNNEKVPVGDVWYSWSFANCNCGVPNQLAWHEWPHPYPHTMPPSAATNYSAAYPIDCVKAGTCPKDTWEHAISEGTLWKYIGDYRIYQCPVGDKGEYVTYAMSHAMNTYPNSGGTPTVRAPTITMRTQIKRTTERFVFLDAGVAKQGAFFINYSGGGNAPAGSFGDHRPMRHGNGTTFSFVDGHAEYRKWSPNWGKGTPNSPRTETGGWGGESNPCDCDWRWFYKVTWGNIWQGLPCAHLNCDD